VVVGVDDKVITTSGASDEGMVIDFSNLKEIMMQEIDEKLDHGFMMWDNDPFKPLFETMKFNEEQKIIFVPFVPTAENIAKYLFDIMQRKLFARDIAIKYVEIYETPTSTAKYTIENAREEMPF